MTVPDSATVSAPADKAGLLDDLLEIFVAPAKVFERRREGRYGLLLTVLVVLALAIALATKGLSAPFFEAQFNLTMAQAAANGQPMPAEATGAGARAAFTWFLVASQSLLIPIFVWLCALFVMLGGKVAGGSLSYRQSALIFTLAGFPRLLSPIVTAIQGAFVDPTTVRSMMDAQIGPARFVDPLTTAPAITGVLANFDLFNLWAFVLIAIGISVIGRVSRANGALGSAVVMACVLALSLIPAAFA